MRDTVEQWKPGLMEAGEKITIEDLLSHRSGIYDAADPTHGSYDLGTDLTDTRLRHLLDHPLTDPPGTKSRYSNPNYWVLGKIIEAATSHSLAHELQRRIFDPAGMTTASLATNLDREPRLVRGYDKNNKDVTPGDVTGIWAAGGVVATVDDVSAFYDALYAGELLPEAAVTDMVTSRGALQGENADYGLGTYIFDTECGEATGHAGWLDGFRSFALHDPDTDRTVVTFVNTTSPAGLDAAPSLAVEALCYS